MCLKSKFQKKNLFFYRLGTGTNRARTKSIFENWISTSTSTPVSKMISGLKKISTSTSGLTNLYMFCVRVQYYTTPLGRRDFDCTFNSSARFPPRFVYRAGSFWCCSKSSFSRQSSCQSSSLLSTDCRSPK